MAEEQFLKEESDKKQDRMDFWQKYQRTHKHLEHIVFCSNGRDTYFKRAAQRKAKEGLWVENPVNSSMNFTLKWDYGDSSIDYKLIQPF